MSKNRNQISLLIYCYSSQIILSYSLVYLLSYLTIRSYKKSFTPRVPFYRRNDYIRISPVQVIDETGENLGEMETDKARQLAYDKGLDLVEVAPNTKPPVCKILSWTKFKYELSKKSKGSSKGKAKERKEMWFSPYIDGGDMNHKLKRVREFLSKKHPVKLTVRVKGRVTREVTKAQLDKILLNLEGDYDANESPRWEGRNYSVTAYPKKSAKKKEGENTEDQKSE